MNARRTLLVLAKAALIVVAGGWVLWPALHGPWIWDDVVNFPENPVLRDPAGLWGIWFAPKSIDYYPVFTSINWIGWHLWGEHTTGYHVLNAALEVVDALLLWRALDGLGLRFGWVGGLLFAVHPMMVESGAWISELKNTLSLFFLLLSFDFWLRAEDRRKEAQEAQYSGYSGRSLNSGLRSQPSSASPWPSSPRPPS
jgi:protein O-mannosyl-transferase